MDSLTAFMDTLIVWEKTLHWKYPLNDNALQIAISSKKLIYINTKGPNQTDNLRARDKQLTDVDAIFYQSLLPITHNHNAIYIFILQ